MRAISWIGFVLATIMLAIGVLTGLMTATVHYDGLTVTGVMLGGALMLALPSAMLNVLVDIKNK